MVARAGNCNQGDSRRPKLGMTHQNKPHLLLHITYYILSLIKGMVARAGNCNQGDSTTEVLTHFWRCYTILVAG